MLKILHTADWHLGQQLCEQNREPEHDAFLNFLIETIQKEQIDLLIHAGDVFHNANPPNSALRQYYQFITALSQTDCRQMVVVGGNHDAAATLNAPKDILNFLNVQVVGGVPENIADEIIEFPGNGAPTEAIICAVPFLKDKDIRTAVAGERYDEREARLKAGIRKHYADVRDLAKVHHQNGLPVIATGHLFAAGGSTTDGEKDIHIGNLGKVGADCFSEDFSYVALGHLHRPQVVGGNAHIRYSGSPIPLSFSEHKDRKQLLRVDLDGQSVKSITPIEIPTYRHLIRFKGDMETVKAQISAFDATDDPLTPWAEVQLVLDEFSANADQQIRSVTEDKRLEILKIRVEYSFEAEKLGDHPKSKALSEMTPKEVFIKKCESEKMPADDQAEILKTFNELQDWMAENRT